MASCLTEEQKQLALRLKSKGLPLAEIGRQVGCTASLVALMRDGHFTSGICDEWRPRPGRLTISDREAILLGLSRGLSGRRRTGFRGKARSLTREFQ